VAGLNGCKSHRPSKEQIVVNKDEIIKKIITVLEGYGPIPKESLVEKLAYRYLDEGHIDSFAIVNFIINLEDAFGIELSAEDTQSDEFRTVEGIVGIVIERLSA
jgi:acyl carrier protein